MVGGRGGTDVGESACLYDRRLAGMDTGVTRLCDSPLAAGRLVVAGFVVGVVELLNVGVCAGCSLLSVTY